MRPNSGLDLKCGSLAGLKICNYAVQQLCDFDFYVIRTDPL